MRRACVLLAAAALVAAASGNLRASRAPAQTAAAAPRSVTPTAAPSVPRPSASTAPSINQRELVQKYCVTCHSDRAKTGGLTLESADPQNTASNPELWEKVVRKLRGGMMPPQGMPRPDVATLD